MGQQFGFIKLSDGSYRIVTKTTYGTKNLSVQSASKDNGANIQQYGYGNSNDFWWLIPTTVPQNDYCFEMSIYASNETAVSGLACGHAFLSFKNITSRYIQFGPVFLKPNEEMTLCKWKMNNIHEGIWYNRDTAIKDVELKNYTFITERIKGSALSTIVNYCKNHDQYNLLTDNCSTLACEIWNQISATKLTSNGLATNPEGSGGLIHTPAHLKAAIMQHSYKTGKTFVANQQMGYLNSNGTFVSHFVPKE